MCKHCAEPYLNLMFKYMQKSSDSKTFAVDTACCIFEYFIFAII